MKTDINFYQIDSDGLAKSLAPLLLKILEEKESALIYSTDESLLKGLNDSLWSYGRNKFIPHAIIFDTGFTQKFPSKRQPIFLTNQASNDNEAQHLIFLEACDKTFVSSFSRAFHFYEPTALTKAKSLAADLSGVASKISSYRKDGGKWMNFSL